jgi:glycosyltransferase involved in cell wall biosynthesis
VTKTSNHILFLSSWSFDEPLTHSYLLPNVRIVRKIIPAENKIFIQTLEKDFHRMSRERKAEIMRSFEVENLEWCPLRYHKFGLAAILLYATSLLKLFSFIKKNNIDTLHAFAPAAGTAALLMHFFLRKKLIIDSWEPHAESMVETGTWKKNSLAYRILIWSEKKQSQHADALLAASPGMKKYAEQKFGMVKGKILHRPACVDTSLFRPDQKTREILRTKMHWSDKVVCVCVSKIGGLYLQEEVFYFFRAGKKVFGDSFHALLISSSTSEEVARLCEKCDYPREKLTHFATSHDTIAQWLNACDFAFNPQKPVPSKRYGTPVKDGEYWACGLPLAIMPHISDDSDIVQNEKAGVIIHSLGPEDIEKAMIEMKILLADEKNIADRMHQIAIKYRGYHIAEKAYNELYGY